MINAPAPLKAVGYQAIAPEYYDAILHPTCAALGEASAALIAQELSKVHVAENQICDVGAGKSVVAKLLNANVSQLETLWLVDSSSQMMRWNDDLNQANVRRLIDEAHHIDRIGIKFDVIVSSLGDPYNSSAFWNSVSNALSMGGVCIFTTPSIEWASIFRNASRQEIEGCALFELQSGAEIYVPSLILPVSEQTEVIEYSGLIVRSIQSRTVDQLDHVPPKMKLLPHGTPVVTKYVAQLATQPPRRILP